MKQSYIKCRFAQTYHFPRVLASTCELHYFVDFKLFSPQLRTKPKYRLGAELRKLLVGELGPPDEFEARVDFVPQFAGVGRSRRGRRPPPALGPT